MKEYRFPNTLKSSENSRPIQKRITICHFTIRSALSHRVERKHLCIMWNEEKNPTQILSERNSTFIAFLYTMDLGKEKQPWMSAELPLLTHPQGRARKTNMYKTIYPFLLGQRSTTNRCKMFQCSRLQSSDPFIAARKCRCVKLRSQGKSKSLVSVIYCEYGNIRHPLLIRCIRKNLNEKKKSQCIILPFETRLTSKSKRLKTVNKKYFAKLGVKSGFSTIKLRYKSVKTKAVNECLKVRAVQRRKRRW